MKVAYLVHRFVPMSVGGTETYVYALAREMSARHEVLVAFPHEGEPRASAAFPMHGFCVATLPRVDAPSWRKLTRPVPDDPAAADRAFKILEAFDPDVIHVYHLQGMTPEIVERALDRGRRVVFTLQDYWYFCARATLARADRSVCPGPEPDFANCETCWQETALEKLALPIGLSLLWPGGSIRGGLASRAERFRAILSRASALVCPSRFIRDRHVAAGIPPVRMRVLRDGVQPVSVRRIASERPRFGFLGSLVWHKGVHVAVEAATRGGHDLTVFGPFDPGDRYHARLRRDAGPTVRFAGRVEGPGEAMASIDCLLVPSLWPENCPGVVLQAMSAGVAVIASDLGGLPELIEHGATGRLCPAGDAARLQAEMESDLRGLRAAPPATLAQYARELDAVYADAVSRSAPRGRA